MAAAQLLALLESWLDRHWVLRRARHLIVVLMTNKNWRDTEVPCGGLKSQVVLPPETVEKLSDTLGRCEELGREGPGHLAVFSVRS